MVLEKYLQNDPFPPIYPFHPVDLAPHPDDIALIVSGLDPQAIVNILSKEKKKKYILMSNVVTRELSM